MVERPLRLEAVQVVSLHAAMFDTRGGHRMVHVTVPYWLGRAFARHGCAFEWLGELTYWMTPSSILKQSIYRWTRLSGMGQV